MLKNSTLDDNCTRLPTIRSPVSDTHRDIPEVYYRAKSPTLFLHVPIEAASPSRVPRQISRGGKHVSTKICFCYLHTITDSEPFVSTVVKIYRNSGEHQIENNKVAVWRIFGHYLQIELFIILYDTTKRKYS